VIQGQIRDERQGALKDNSIIIFFILMHFSQLPIQKLELLLVSLKTFQTFFYNFPNMKLIVRVLHRRLPKAHTCHHCMVL
jgi:hypothetical protein